jgi:hypothetical protein
MDNTQSKVASRNCFNNAMDAYILAFAAAAFRLDKPEQFRLATAHLPPAAVNAALDRLMMRAVNGA